MGSPHELCGFEIWNWFDITRVIFDIIKILPWCKVSDNNQIWFDHIDAHVTVYPKKYAHGFCFAVLCCGYTLTDFPISIRLTSLALWQSNDCPSASKATLMNMDKYFMWIHYERLHNHNKAKHNKTVCIFLGIYCRCMVESNCFVWWSLLWRKPRKRKQNHAPWYILNKQLITVTS